MASAFDADTGEHQRQDEWHIDDRHDHQQHHYRRTECQVMLALSALT